MRVYQLRIVAVTAAEIAPLGKNYSRRPARKINKRKFNQSADFHLAAP